MHQVENTGEAKDPGMAMEDAGGEDNPDQTQQQQWMEPSLQALIAIRSASRLCSFDMVSSLRASATTTIGGSVGSGWDGGGDSITAANRFWKGVSWSPDGLCVLTNNEDNVVRLFEVPYERISQHWQSGAAAAVDAEDAGPQREGGWGGGATLAFGRGMAFQPCLSSKIGATVFDFCWNPRMQSSQPDSCFFLTTSRESPIHMWSAFTGKLRASYRAFDHLDELNAALSLCLSSDGSKLFSGFNGKIRVFDVARPGRQCVQFNTLKRRKKGKQTWKEGQKGLVSCLAYSPACDDLLAAGSYEGSAGVYDCRDNNLCCILDCNSSGVTQIKFSPDGNFLFAGSRKAGDILCWDFRNTSQVIAKYPRNVLNNQRVAFDIDPIGGKYLVSGSQDNKVHVFDLAASPDAETFQVAPAYTMNDMGNVVNGVALHSHFSSSYPLLATCGGERKFFVDGLSDSEDETISSHRNPSSKAKAQSEYRNELSLWRLEGPGHTSSLPAGSGGRCNAEGQ